MGTDAIPIEERVGNWKQNKVMTIKLAIGITENNRKISKKRTYAEIANGLHMKGH